MNHTSSLKEKLNDIPEAPGIYKMLDSKGTIIYIGKSKCLKKRVKSYFVDSPKWEKVKRMVPLIKDIEYVVTDTHLEAMLLECELIKKIQPYFNVQMKNDKSYVYVKIGTENRFAPLSVVYERGEFCYGPFRRKRVLQEMIDDLKKIYPIVKNKEKYQFEYHVLPVEMTSEEFKENSKVMKELFLDTKKMERLIQQLEKKMEEEAAYYRFELASKYRDIIQAVRYLKNGIDRYKELVEKNMLLKLEILNGYKLIFVSRGQVVYKESYAEITSKVQEKFLETAWKKNSLAKYDVDDKGRIDYQNILYSEILSLPNESILMLEN